LFFGQVHNLGAMLGEVATRLQRHEVKVIVYLRRQDQLYSSFYNQDVKGIRQWFEGAYQFYQTHQIFEHGYSTVLGMWSDALGKESVIVRPFEASQWPDADIVKDFGRIIGDLPLRGDKNQNQNNDSLGMIQLYVKRCLNKVGFNKHANEDVLKVLYTICPEEPASGCIYIHRPLYRKFREHWLEENGSIAADYLAGRDLFSVPIPTADQMTMYQLDRFHVALYVIRMFEHFDLGKDRMYRQLFSKATLLVLADMNLWNALDSERRSRMLEWATAVEQ